MCSAQQHTLSLSLLFLCLSLSLAGSVCLMNSWDEAMALLSKFKQVPHGHGDGFRSQAIAGNGLFSHLTLLADAGS